MYGIQTDDALDTDGTDHVGWIDNGDFTEYSVVFLDSGFYNFDFRVADLDGGGYYDVSMDGSRIINKLLPTTGSMTVYDVWGNNKNLTEGYHTFRIY